MFLPLSACSLFMHFFGKAETGTCILRYWLLLIAASLFIGALVIKQYCVWRVFGNTTLRVVNITYTTMLGFLFLLISPTLILLIIWSAADTPEARYDDDHRHVVCLSSYQWVFLGIFLGYQGLLSICSSILAFITRDFPSAYSDSKLIGFALYNATLTMVAMVPICVAARPEKFVDWMFIVCAITFFFIATYCIIMVPKMWGIFIWDWGKDKTELEQMPQTISKTKNKSGTTKKSTSNTHSSSS